MTGVAGNRFKLTTVALQLLLTGGLLVSNVGQRLSFKSLGYVLGPFPYFVLLSISFAFVVAFAVIYIFIVCTTGGWLPEVTNYRTLGTFWVIGALNALQGVGMVFANPHVPGYLQALFQQAVIPMTLLTSVLALRSRYSLQQYVAVLVIISGILLQLCPDIMQFDAHSGSTATPAGQSLSLLWSMVFLTSQVPVSCAAVLQEYAFATVHVNVFHMMFWASAAQFTTLAVMAPLDTVPSIGDSASEQSFLAKMATAWHIVCSDGAAAWALFMCIATMLLSQLTQALVVKQCSATYAVLCMALVLPSSAIAFTLPVLMGSHAEVLGPTALGALCVVFLGVVLYRAGDSGSATPKVNKPPSPLPKICSAGVGIIQSEYSNAKHSSLPLWEEQTLCEADTHDNTSGFMPLSSGP